MNVQHAGAMNQNTKTELNIGIDNNQNGFINMWVDNRANGAATTENHLVRNTSFGSWEDALSDGSLFTGLSSTATLEFVRIAPATGNLYALVRDADKLYLGRQLSDGISWGKEEITGVPAAVSRDNLQMVISNTGMVTLSWHSQGASASLIDINAKHYMNGVWEATQTISVPTEKVLTPHFVDDNGLIQVAWLVQSSGASGCGFDIMMASYEHMVGWSQAFNGPSCIGANVVVKSVNNGSQRLVVVADVQSYEIDAYIFNSDGSWAPYTNINVADSSTVLTNHDEIQVITGGTGQFLVAWRELIGSQIRYKSTTVHRMNNMWHWGAPTLVSGTNTEVESHLQLTMDNGGNAYAVWTSIDSGATTSHVYANQLLASSGSWDQTPEMLIEYDTNSEGSVEQVSISIDMNGRPAIAWDQQMLMGTMTMHHIWTVEGI
jgi:hypothetical protein